jgi:hypothetical protein
MAKVIAVLYPDPVDGYPKKYARDDIPKITKYPDGQTAPTVIAASAGRARRPIYLTRDAARIPLLGKSGRERRPVRIWSPASSPRTTSTMRQLDLTHLATAMLARTTSVVVYKML